MKTPKQQVLDAIDPTDFWQSEFPEWNNEKDLVVCPIHGDESPSLSLHSTGKFQCFGCSFKGTSVIGYFTDVYCGGNFRVALRRLFNRYVQQLVSDEEIERYQEELIKRPKVMMRLLSMRGWNKETVEQFKLGLDIESKRITIPISNLTGYFLDVRKHDSLRLQKGKRIPMIARASNGAWFPLWPETNPFDEEEIFIMEGEPDVITAHTAGINAITLTGGAGELKNLGYQRATAFTGKHVVICTDNDEAGKDAAKALEEQLAKVEILSLKTVFVPEGKDFCDFFVNHGGSKEVFLRHVRETPYRIKPTFSKVTDVHISDASKPELAGTNISSRVLVSGKGENPYLVPKRIEYRCIPGEQGYCPTCRCRDDGRDEWVVQANDPDILKWLVTPPDRFDKLIRLGLDSSCNRKMQVKVLEQQAIEHLKVVPGLDAMPDVNQKFATMDAYYVGHGVDANKHYEINAIPIPHPKTKEAVLIVQKVRGSHDAIETFALSRDRISELREIFGDSSEKTLRTISATLSDHYTNIRGRPDLHIAVDLCFHSPIAFTFNGERIPKGSIELLLLGDGRTGKTYVAEGISRAYGVGIAVSGENASYMGLVGGLSKLREAFILQWGALPLNNGRLVIVDEASGLNEIMGKLSRIRSEGIAEINKGGIHSKTQANARIIWTANPRGGRALHEFTTGVEAVADLIKLQEDIARFDLVVVVARGEVSIADINKPRGELAPSKFTQDVLQDVVLWAWSRKPEQVIFTNEATEYILESSIRLSGLYNPAIPLIQGENVRFKLAKVAAAIAARCFSTKDGVHLDVTEEHAKLAVKIMAWLYNRPACGYNKYSEAHAAKAELVRVKELNSIFLQLNATWEDFVDNLLETEYMTHRDIQDWLSVGPDIAQEFTGIMVRSNAIKKKRKDYVKRPSFIKYLQELKKGGLESLREADD